MPRTGTTGKPNNAAYDVSADVWNQHVGDYVSQTDTGNQNLASQITVAAGKPIKTNTIEETTATSGVTVDSCLIKDGKAADSNLLEASTKAQVQDHAPKAHTHPVSDLTDHNKAAHDALDIDADTVDGVHAAGFFAGTWTTGSCSGSNPITTAHGLGGTPTLVLFAINAVQPYVASYNCDATNITFYHNAAGSLTIKWAARL